MNRLYIENIRCFAESHNVRIAPLTLLLGENSTGKSTFLAIRRLAADISQGNIIVGFNEDPFLLGAYNQIANYRAFYGRAKSFKIGFDIPLEMMREPKRESKKRKNIHVSSQFIQSGARPIVSKIDIRIDRRVLGFEFSEDEQLKNVVYNSGDHEEELDLETEKIGLAIGSPGEVNWHYFVRAIKFHLMFREKTGQNVSIPDIDDFLELNFGDLYQTPRPFAIAPIRSRPERTYDPKDERPEPEGGHIPMILARMQYGESSDWRDIVAQLEEYSAEAGLFEHLRVKRFGKTESEPFQVRVKIAGPDTNLIDVGYGVSQVLPILVDSLRTPGEQTYLLQQPEVHLHPRAQAALGTFFANLVKRNRKNFLIETHSDYLVDRVRMEVRKGKSISSEDVTILYFERDGQEVNIHQIDIDENGNLVGAPPGYRKFFMEEERRFVGI